MAPEAVQVLHGRCGVRGVVVLSKRVSADVSYVVLNHC